MTALAFLGTGLIATPMIRRLLAAGHTVRVWNRTRSRALPLLAEGALWAEHPAEAVEGAAAVILCLTDAQAVEAVVFGPSGVTQAHASPPFWSITAASTPGNRGIFFTSEGRHGWGLDRCPGIGRRCRRRAR